MATVYVVNKGGHDFSSAKNYGNLVFLTEGHYSPFAVDKMYREMARKLKDSNPDDFILCTGLTIMNSIACSCFAMRHGGKLNMLLFRNGRYIQRTLMIGELI